MSIYEIDFFFQSPGALMAELFTRRGFGGGFPFDPTTTLELTSKDGYLAVKHVSESGDQTTEVNYISLGTPTEEPLGLRAALATGMAALGMSDYVYQDFEGGYTLAQWDAIFDSVAAFLAAALDHFTTGSSEAPIKRTITAAGDRVHSWLYIVPVAADAGFQAALFQATIFKSSSTGQLTALGETALPSTSTQIAVPGSLAQAAQPIDRIAQAVEDGNKRTTIVGLNDKGPLYATESSEIIEVG